MLLRVHAIAACVGALACSSAEPRTDAGRDAGRDAGARDSGRDAGRRIDAGPDAGRDGGPMDPMWVPLEGTPDACEFERALRPEVLFTPHWEPCDAQPVGCLQETWEAPFHGYAHFTGWYDGEHGYFVVVIVDSSDHNITAIGRTDGPTIAAWRTAPIRSLLAMGISCGVDIGVGDGYAAVSAHYLNGRALAENADHLYHAPLDQIGAATTPIAVITEPVRGGSSVQRIEVSADIVALEIQPLGAVWAVTPNGQQRALNVDPVLGIPQRISVAGPHVFWEDWAGLVRAAHSTFDGPATHLVDADPGDVKHFLTDGESFAWVQGYDRPPGGEYQRVEFWTAPLAFDAADIAPRMVRTLPVRGGDGYGGGWYALLTGSLVPADPLWMEFVRIEDGTRREWRPGAGIGTPPLYVSDHEMLYDTGRLVRLDPHTLAAVAE